VLYYIYICILFCICLFLIWVHSPKILCLCASCQSVSYRGELCVATHRYQ
jgi:hypothetical protein